MNIPYTVIFHNYFKACLLFFQVRVGILKHLFDFINILPTDLQKDYLPVFNDFLKTDNMRNWRFRQDLAQ